MLININRSESAGRRKKTKQNEKDVAAMGPSAVGGGDIRGPILRSGPHGVRAQAAAGRADQGGAGRGEGRRQGGGEEQHDGGHVGGEYNVDGEKWRKYCGK